MDNTVILVENVSKVFKLPHEKTSSIKGALINKLRGGNRSYERQQVLNNVSFDIKEGEFFGIVGRNGSGKSTLLKMLAGIYMPTSGNIQVTGKLTPFIELGVGFSPELTGRENIFLNGSLLGFNRKEMEAMYGDIVSFAELEKFMDQKLKNYSSGMQVRLAFSIAIRAQSDILLLDEVLAVGDEAFQRKCYNYFEDLKRNNKTVIIVTHDMAAVEKFCTRAILIEEGVILNEGDPSSVANAYRKLFSVEAEPETEAEAVETTPDRWGEKSYTVHKVAVKPEGRERVSIAIDLKCNAKLNDNIIIAYTVKSNDGKSLFGESAETTDFKSLNKGDIASCTLSFLNILAGGEYYLDLSIRKAADNVYCDFWTDCTKFKIKDVPDTPLHIVVDTKFKKL